MQDVDFLFKFRSGTHGLNEELGRHRRREGKTECSLCGNECENVSHVLWECSTYSSTRASFMKKFQELLEDDNEDFESLENVGKSSYVLGSELWENKFYGLLALVKEYNYCRDVGNTKTNYMTVTQDLICNSILGLHLGRGVVSSVSQNGKFSQNGTSGQKGKVHLGPNVISSAHNGGCVVNDSGTMAAI